MTYAHWRNLEPEHWRALERCCESRLGRAQVDEDLAKPLVDLGWIRGEGWWYSPTEAGHRAWEARRDGKLVEPVEPRDRFLSSLWLSSASVRPPAAPVVAGTRECLSSTWEPVEPHPGPIRLWLRRVLS